MKMRNLSLICFGCLALNFLACSSKIDKVPGRIMSTSFQIKMKEGRPILCRWNLYGVSS